MKPESYQINQDCIQSDETRIIPDKPGLYPILMKPVSHLINQDCIFSHETSIIPEKPGLYLA